MQQATEVLRLQPPPQCKLQRSCGSVQELVIHRIPARKVRNASLMSLVASALRMDLDIGRYLESVLTHMLRRTAKTEELLPDRWTAAHLSGGARVPRARASGQGGYGRSAGSKKARPRRATAGQIAKRKGHVRRAIAVGSLSPTLRAPFGDGASLWGIA
jgi:hypothetical protein